MSSLQENQIKELLLHAVRVSESSKSTRVKCGAAILTHVGVIIAGNNHSIDDEEEVVENNHTVNFLHAEESAILQAASVGLSTFGGVMFSLERPCQRCMMAIAASGIQKCYYLNDYHSTAHSEEYCSESLKEKIGLEKYEDKTGDNSGSVEGREDVPSIQEVDKKEEGN